MKTYEEKTYEDAHRELVESFNGKIDAPDYIFENLKLQLEYGKISKETYDQVTQVLSITMT